MFARWCETVRNRPQPIARGLYGCAYGDFCKRVTFGGFRCRIASFRVAGVALCDSNMFQNASKLVLCGKRNTFATFSENAFQFSWQAQHFGNLHRHFPWQASAFFCWCPSVRVPVDWWCARVPMCPYAGQKIIKGLKACFPNNPETTICENLRTKPVGID